MEIFNHKSRKENIMKISIIGVACSLANILMGLIYRRIFLYVLSASYLGISGLFTNILSMLSLAELGITSAITYRFYEPIVHEDIQKVGELMRFFKRIYRIIMSVILVGGLAVMPFLNYLIKDSSEIPPDVNLYLVYMLYLIQTISSYIYSYKQTLLSADQRQYILSIWQIGMRVTVYICQIMILVIWGNFTVSLATGIAVTIFFNILNSVWITKKYEPVFQVKSDLAKEEKKKIYKDTRATMYHKIGGTVLTGTDNLVLSAFVGVMAAGIYSNYSMIIFNLNILLSQMLGNFTASMGNVHVTSDKEAGYIFYRRLLFINLWIAGMMSCCLYMLIDDFICLWIGSDMLLENIAVVAICLQFYLNLARQVTVSYTNASGLFVKDRMRPLIQSGINLGVSIFLVLKIGISGVFWGTVVSQILTVFWRDPLILYKYEFKKSTWEYWVTFVRFSLTTLISVVLLKLCEGWFSVVQNSIIAWILKGVFSVFVYMVLAVVMNLRQMEFQYYFRMFTELGIRIVSISNKRKQNYINQIKRRIKDD